MKAILSADRKWGLGYQGRLLVSIPSDLRFFRETTMGHVVVMGRKTLATLPAGQPLKGRTNIILSRDPEWTVRGATVVHSIRELMEALKRMRTTIFMLRAAEKFTVSFSHTVIRHTSHELT